MKKIIATILGGATIVGGTYALSVEQVSTLETEIIKIHNEKKVILKDNIWKSARLNEIPEWNISVVSAEEMSSAYTDKAAEMGATVNSNLFEGLREETIKQGINCITSAKK